MSAVEHPSHYTSHPSGIECIEIVQHHNFNIGSAIKYLWRNGLKDSSNPEKQIEDVSKAVVQIEFEKKRLSANL